MNAPPLTHHDILALAEPFARRGRRVDLAASDRIARRVVFQEMQRISIGMHSIYKSLSLQTLCTTKMENVYKFPKH